MAKTPALPKASAKTSSKTRAKTQSQNLEPMKSKNNNMALTSTPGSTQTPMAMNALKKGGMVKKSGKKK